MNLLSDKILDPDCYPQKEIDEILNLHTISLNVENESQFQKMQNKVRKENEIYQNIEQRTKQY